MKLVLAEKPSVAQSIAKVLGAAKREDGYLEGNGYVVSWCVGHLVELAQPEVYDAKYSKWAYADLPIFPMDWQYEVSAGTKKQFGILKKLMAREDVASLVCATDAGREGELIFRLVYHKAGCRKPFERLWISSMEDVAIKEGFENLRSGTEYDALYEAALCRERADWIVGINATRLFSTLYGQTLNVGRVMTPTLAMAVMREAAISAFKPELFYTVQIGLDGFTAASERFKTKAAAEAVKQSCSVAIVQKAECKEKTEKPPALYDLTSLQREANRVLGYTAQQTLDYTQNLYEKKLVTYPRTDSRFLTEDMAHSLTDLVKLAFHTFPVEDVDNIPVHAEQVVNNKKVTDHHAIIPTRELQKCNLSELPKGELAILQLISNRLCVAVGDPHRYAETVIELDCGGTVFSTKGKTVVQDGWKALVQKNDSTKSDENVQTLPSVSVGDEMTVSGTEIKEGKTSPPKHFTEDTLLSAMETAGADEMPDEVERKGLGTPATRAGIIEKLVRIGFLERKGDKKTKHLIPTHKGTALVTVMPEQIQSPSMTADWEEKLLLIEKGEYASEDFMDEIKDVIAGLIQNYEVIRDSEVMMSKEANSIGKCPLCGSAVEDKAKAFFCSNRACKFALWKNNRYFASIGMRRSIEVKFSELTAEWRINGKSSPNYNDVAAYVTYGTERANAYRILEETLNLKDIRIYDTIEDADGKQKRVLNKKETTLAQQKQQAIKDAFRDWIWRDPHRRETLSTKYNELFNSTRPREYDGSHIRFGGMNPDITLREHQRNAIAHVLYGGNTLLAHEVGAGKTFEMAASAMESKRLGLSQKSLFVVPNHLTLQWANEFLHLYPSAKLLVATKKDFETANRKKFCARIATGDYDAVIIGHSQFEKIPLSAERQERQLREQIDEIEGAIAELKWQRGENFTIKQMEKTRKSLEARLDKLLAADKKDDVITFEQLGVDRLFVDESHAFKNLFLYTKMRNVAGLSTSEAQKSSDMFMKCRYMDELTGGRGVIFATGTPVSNSMTELYTVMRYLQYSTLQQKNLTHFDSWASTFGETTTAIELAPEGTGYRARTRFAKFFNLPELMNMFKEVADIKTSDQLHLPVPEAKFETVVVQPSEYQKDMVASLSERAADVHAGIVDPSVDNMLKITSDGRKLGLDQRLMNTLLPDDPDSKLNACVGNILRIWQDGQADKLTQLVFCDLSTPKNDGTFNVYDDVKTKLIANGVPAEEVAFIHDADTEAKKKDLFAKVRTGQVRVLLGSTQKMGAGTNVQDKLVAVHHLDVGWRPSDMTQRNGRIIRQGNRNKEVQVYQYVTEGTFDAYLYQTLENKQKFISQIMTSKSPVRSCDDVDEQALSYAEIKALCAGNPLIKEKMDLDIDVARLKVLKADHQSQQYRMEDKLLKYFPAEIEKQTGYIHGFEADIKTVEAHPQIADGFCGMEIMGKAYTEKADAGEILLAACKDTKSADPVPLGSYRGFQMELSFDSFRNEFDVTLKGAVSHRVALGTDARGNITRLDNALAGILERLERANEQLNNLYNQQEAAKAEVGKPFPQEAELTAKSQRLAELDAALNMEDSVENRDERSESERPSVLADLKSKAEHIPPAKYSETREEVL